MIDIIVKSEQLAQSLHTLPEWSELLNSLAAAEVAVALWIDGQDQPYQYWVKALSSPPSRLLPVEAKASLPQRQVSQRVGIHN